VAPVYTRLGRDTDAAHAWSRVIDTLGSTAERESNLGEALMRAAGGAVTPEAKAAFTRAAALAPDDSLPRFYLALALSQAGRTDEAKAAWQALLHAPEDAAWVPAARAQLAALETPVAGPAADDVAAAANLPPAERQAMIETMVASLADRLKTRPSDADGWARLIRSYIVLGRADDARAALVGARTALAGDAAKLATVEAAAREAGLAEATE
jgi:cytochrome c-type biogenesis protein CcmH